VVHPGIYVYSVMIPEGGSADDERKAGFVCFIGRRIVGLANA
jgi:hypothetical protein